MSSRLPVVTGLGIIAAPGCSADEIWRGFASGQSGLRPLSLFESPRYGQVLTGEVRHDLLKMGAPLRGSRGDRLAWLAARDALSSAKLGAEHLGEHAGVLLGSSVGGSFDSEGFLSTLIKRKKMRARPTRFHECVSSVHLIADYFGLFGPSMAVATACSSGALAIAAAAELIISGEAEVMLTGGADSLSRITWGGFHSLLLVDGAGCRPFDANRAGMSLGEGGAVLVLESESNALRRRANILARLSGWAASCDAYHATAPEPEGAGAAAAMQAAMRRAGLSPGDIGYINAHGTGTRDNDLAEAKALRTVFGCNVPPVSSTKRFFGHALAASGAIEAMVCVEALRRQELPPNPGFSTIDPAIGLEPVTSLRPASLDHVMSNSFGFGGNNAVVIFSKPEIRPKTLEPRQVAAIVSGLGKVGPGSVTNQKIEPPMPEETVTARGCGALTDGGLLTPNQRRRLGRAAQMALIAAKRGAAPEPGRRMAVAIGTGMGCLGEAEAFVENLISKDEREPMPARFPGSVHNAPAAQVAIDLAARGLNSAPTAGDISFECALWQAMSQLRTGEADCALAGAVDEINKYVLGIGQRWGLWTDKSIPGEGAVIARLEPSTEKSAAAPRVTAVRFGRYRRPFDAELEAEWIASTADLESIDTIITGAGGSKPGDEMYEAVLASLSTRTRRKFEHRTYKESCGDFHAASAFGFALALDLVKQGCRGALVYTLSPRGSKALCCLQA